MTLKCALCNGYGFRWLPVQDPRRPGEHHARLIPLGPCAECRGTGTVDLQERFQFLREASE